MMGISATIIKGASVVTAIGAIGGGFAVLETRHAPMSVVSEISVGNIFDLVEMAQKDGSQEWICRAIEKEIIKLCSNIKEHYLCEDKDARNSLRRKAGCDVE